MNCGRGPVPAIDALRAQVVRSAGVCGFGIDAAAEALAMSEEGLRSWMMRWIGSSAWPADARDLGLLLERTVAPVRSTLGPVGRLATIAEGMWRLHPGAIASKKRTRPEVRARQAVCWAIYRHYGDDFGYARIGRALERDHSTIIHAVQTAEAVMARDPEYAARCQLLRLHAASTQPVAIETVRTLPDWAFDPAGWLARQEAERAVTLASAVVSDEPDCELRPGTWCDQCDALVGAAKIAACGDRWCSLKGRVAASARPRISAVRRQQAEAA